jgi:D-beta-D-heptose 7-phosphate kinase/D-beta-D-heptose 1-phosphate adenosyltransferase
MAEQEHLRLATLALEAIDWAEALVIEDYDKGVVTGSLSRALLSRARERGIPSVVDPKLRHFFDFPGATVFKPNARELAAALGLEKSPRDESTLHPLLARLECDCLLVTLGDEGMLLVEPATETRLFPPEAREVFDVTGAGDTVTAVLAVSLQAGSSIAQAAYLANLAAGIEVTRLGAVPVTAEELLEELRA